MCIYNSERKYHVNTWPTIYKWNGLFDVSLLYVLYRVLTDMSRINSNSFARKKNCCLVQAVNLSNSNEFFYPNPHTGTTLAQILIKSRPNLCSVLVSNQYLHSIITLLDFGENVRRNYGSSGMEGTVVKWRLDWVRTMTGTVTP